jgi:hypothetical protein
MKTLRISFAFLLTMIFAASCATRGPGPSRPGADPTMLTQTTTDRKGNVVETVTDNRGKAAAAEGQAMLTTEEVWKNLVTKLPENESPKYGWTITETAYSNQDAPNTVVIEQLREEHKNILAEAAKLGAAGMKKDYDKAIASAAVIMEEIGRRLAGNGEKPDGNDRVSIINRTLSVGPDHTVVPLEQAKQMGGAVLSRHGHQNTNLSSNLVARIDTSTTEEIQIAFDAGVRIEEIRLAYAVLDAQKDDAETDDGDDIAPTPVVPSKDVPGKVEPVEVTTAGDQSFLWKPVSDSNGHLVVIFPASFNGRIKNVAVNGERGTFSAISNGNRTHWRFGKPGSAYGPVANVTADVDGAPFKVTVNTPSERTTLQGIKPPAKPVPVSDLIPAPAVTNSTEVVSTPGESPAR